MKDYGKFEIDEETAQELAIGELILLQRSESGRTLEELVLRKIELGEGGGATITVKKKDE